MKFIMTILKKSQKILNEWIGYKPKLLIPPGNVYSKKTIRAAMLIQ